MASLLQLMLATACADSLAMPAHWYYSPAQLAAALPDLSKFNAPPHPHVGSFLDKCSTGTGGRGSQQSNIVGDVILHGKKKLWATPQTHYHHGLAAGDNTLNFLISRLMVRFLAQRPAYDARLEQDAEHWLASYVEFMTTPGSHRDTYAEAYHRDFFENWANGIRPLRRCPGVDKHDTASAGGFVSLAPLVFYYAGQQQQPAAAPDAPVAAVLAHLRLSHVSQTLDQYAGVYVGVLWALLHRDRNHTPSPLPLLISAADELARLPGARLGPGAFARLVADGVANDTPVTEIIGGVWSPACYISGSFPAALYLAARYGPNLEAALIENTRAGGDNVHRGCIVAALIVAAHGELAVIPERWLASLVDVNAIRDEVNILSAGAVRNS